MTVSTSVLSDDSLVKSPSTKRTPTKRMSQSMPMPVKPLLITTGEPAGIGMDIVLTLAATGHLQALNTPVWVLADAKALIKRAQQLVARQAIAKMPTWQVIDENLVAGALIRPEPNTDTDTDTDTDNNDFIVIDIKTINPVKAGVIDVSNAAMVARQLELAHQLAFNKQVAAIITAPLQKSALIDGGVRLKDGSMFSGHTEYFMQQCGCDKVVMMLANDAMKVALVTTHLPLKDVSAAINKNNVRQTVQIVLDELTQKFAIAHPKILVCGLNPHAGEGGHLGHEEIEVIDPVLNEFKAKGADISNAMPADTLFTPRHLKNCDAVIAMYHDQGLPVLKSHGFGDTVNITLGLPYIRTSVDHGTALDLAGSGKASASSLYQALLMAQQMANKVANQKE